MSKVVFLLAPGLHLLDLAGPAQAFSTAAGFEADYSLHYLGEQEDITSHQGVPLRAELRWPTLGPADLVLIPGWRRSRPVISTPFSEGTLRRLREHHAYGGTVASVCSGAFALARAGLLNGRRCTTHHHLQEALARHYPAATVVRDVLYTVDGRVVTSAGIASGIDLTLHLLATRHGPAFAARVAREMVVYARRNGEAEQASVMLRHRDHASDLVHRVQDVIDARFTEPLPLPELAATGQVSERTLTRVFRRAVGMTPLRYQQILRLERAEHLIGQGATAEAAARAVGFAGARMLRRLRSRSPGPRTDLGRIAAV